MTHNVCFICNNKFHLPGNRPANMCLPCVDVVINGQDDQGPELDEYQRQLTDNDEIELREDDDELYNIHG